MSDTFHDIIDKCSRVLRLDFTSAEFAQMAADNSYSVEAVAAVHEVFEYIRAKKEQATIQMLMKTSRLPLKHAKTFENFDFSVLRGKDIEKLKSLPSLAASTPTGTSLSSALPVRGRRIWRWPSAMNVADAG